MTPKQRRFVAEYLKDSNATQAAIRAGYSERSAYELGSRLLREPEVAAAVTKHVDKVAMSADEVLQGLADIARDAEKDSDRIAALGLLGKYHRLFTEKVEVSGNLSLEQLVPKRKLTHEGEGP